MPSKYKHLYSWLTLQNDPLTIQDIDYKIYKKI